MARAELISALRARTGEKSRIVAGGDSEYFEGDAEVPVASGRSSKWRARLFVLLVLSPSIWAAIYYGLIASDRYVSETQFIVRGLESNRATGLDAVFRTFGIARTADDANSVATYVLSRDALRELQTKLPMREIFTRSGSDILSRYPHVIFPDSFERLHEYYLERVAVVQDPEKGVTTLRVEAYRPDDAQAIAKQLLVQAEALVNRMNDRARTDAVSDAQIDVEAARKELLAAQAALTAFRNAQMMIDPSKNSLAQLETITGLSTSLGQALAGTGEDARTTPNSPELDVLRARTEALEAQIAAERAKIGGGDDATLAVSVSKFERLTMLRDLAGKSFAAAVASLESARQDARRRQIYIEEIVEPNLADESTKPERVRNFVAVLFVSLSLLAMGWILSVGIKEHSR